MATSPTARFEPAISLCATLETPHDQGKEIYIQDLPPFQIRKFVSSIRSLDFSKCWPFRQKILEKSLTLGVKPPLPPFSPPKRYDPIERKHSEGYQQVFRRHEEAESVQHCAQNEADYEHLETSSAEEEDDDNNEEHFKTGFEEEEEEDQENQVEEDQENQGEEEDQENQGEEEDRGNQVKEEDQENQREEQEKDQNLDAHSDGMQSNSTNNVGASNALPGSILGFETSCDISGDSACICDDGFGNVEVDLLALEKRESKEDRRGESASTIFQSRASLAENAELHVNIDENNACAKLLNNDETLDSSMGSTKKSDNASKYKLSVLQIAPQAVSKSLREKANELKHLDSLSGEQEISGPQHKAEKGRNCEDYSFPGLTIDVLTPQVCPVCLNFTSTSNTALNAHIDHCLESVLPSENGERRACKSRTKPRKMRSMIEICAVAPPRTLEDFELCSQTWALNDTHPNDQSSNDMQSDDNPCDASAFEKKYRVARRQPGKFIPSRLRSVPWKENMTSEVDQPSIEQRQNEARDFSASKPSEFVMRRRVSSKNTIGAESEELQYTGQCFLEEQSTISPSLKASPMHPEKCQVRKKNGPSKHFVRSSEDHHTSDDTYADLDICILDDKEVDLILLSRLETTILDTSADDENRLQQDFSSSSEKSGSDLSAHEGVHKSGDTNAQHSENRGGSPSWIVTNGKYQMKVPSSDSRRLDEAFKNRKRPQIDFDWIEENVNVNTFAENENVDKLAGKLRKNKRTMHKTRRLVNVTSQEMGKDGFPKIRSGMETLMNALEGETLCQDAYLSQGGKPNNIHYNTLKRKSLATLKEKTKGDDIVKHARFVDNFDSSNASKHNKTSKTPESMSLILDTIEHGITAESHSACSVDKNTIVRSHEDCIAVDECIFSQNMTSKEVVEKVNIELEPAVHTNRDKQGHVIGTSSPSLEQLRICQNVASDCTSTRQLSKNQCSIELSEETCSTSMVESIKIVSNTASLHSHEGATNTDPYPTSGPKAVVQKYNPSTGRAFFYRNEPNKHQIISTSERMLPGDLSCSQVDGINMAYGYVTDQVKQNFPLIQTNYQLDIEPPRLNINGPSHRLGTQEISISGARLPVEQHFLRNNSCDNGVHDREDVRSDPFKTDWVNRNQHFLYQKDSEKKHFMGNKSAEKQKHTAVNEDIDKGLQMSLQTDMTYQNLLDTMNPRVLTSNIGAISTSELGLQKGKMSDLLDNFVRSTSIMSQDPMQSMSKCQPTAVLCPQHMFEDLYVGHKYDKAFPLQSSNSHQTSNRKVMHHPQYLQPQSYTMKERNPGFITEYVNSTDGTTDACGELSTSSGTHMPRNIMSSKMNGGVSKAGLNNYNAVEYSGEQGVVHIFGNPVFKLMGKNVMVTNSNIKSLAVGNSMDQNEEQWFYHSSNVGHDPQHPQERFTANAEGWYGDSSGLKEHSFALGNLRTHSHTLQEVSSNKFGHMDLSSYKDHFSQSISCIQGERSQILHSVPQTHSKQQLSVGVNSNKQDSVKAFLVEDHLLNTGTSISSMLCAGGNSISESSNTTLVHDGHVRAHAPPQAFPSSSLRCILKPKTREGTSNIVNRYHQQSGTLADIVRSSERKNSRQVTEHV